MAWFGGILKMARGVKIRVFRVFLASVNVGLVDGVKIGVWRALCV